MLWAFQEVTKRPRDEVLALAHAAATICRNNLSAIDTPPDHNAGGSWRCGGDIAQKSIIPQRHLIHRDWHAQMVPHGLVDADRSQGTECIVLKIDGPTGSWQPISALEAINKGIPDLFSRQYPCRSRD
jgi:hypothetical protein